MRMEELMDKFGQEVFVCQEIDFDYEFDAPQFFDFTRPEAEIDSIQAELWFETAAGYPTSEFMEKLRLVQNMLMKKMESCESHKNKVRTVNVAADNISSMDSEVSNPVDDGTGLEARLNPVQSGCRSSTLMKPTASHLAKQRKPRETNEFLRSCFQNSALDTQATKRKKLNTGFIHKGAYLKQKTSFHHKKPKKVYVSNVNPLRVTVPKGPYLETAIRAKRRIKIHRLIVTCKNDEQAGYIFKARPLNRKILEAPSLSFPKKSIPQPPKFHEFFLKTSERAMQHKYCNTRKISFLISQQRSKAKDGSRSSFSESLNHERGNTINKLKGNPLRKEIQIVTCRKLLTNPPADLFSKLPLVAEIQQVV